MQSLFLLCAVVGVNAAVPKTDWDARFASEPDPVAKVVYENGMPRISLNGRIVNAEFNQNSVSYGFKVRAVKKMASLGITINQLTLRPAEYEMASGIYSFTAFEEKVRKLLEVSPDARILLLVRMEFPKWLAAHPGEGIEYANGPLVASGDERINRVARPSAASKAFRAEVRSFLTQLGAYTCSKPWGKRVIAIRPCWGVYTEWHVYAFDQGPDVGPAMTAAFRRWKNGLYADDNPPTMEERMDREDPFFLDRAKHQKVMDFYDCMANEVSDCLLEVAHVTKDAFPGRLVGMYYGYVMTNHSPEGANCMLDKVLSSPYVDFLSNPADYTSDSRLAGGAYYHRTIPESYHRYGKLAMLEDDMRHYHIVKYISHKSLATRSPREAEMTTRRNWLNQYFDGCGIQMYDPESNPEKRPFIMDAPPVWKAIKETKKVLNEIGGRADNSGNDVAVVVDWRGRFQRSPEELEVYSKIYKYSMIGLTASGVPFDLMTLDDFLAKPEKRYGKAVFLNVVNPEGEMREALQKRVSAPGFKSAWMIRCPFRLSASSAKVYAVSALPEGDDMWRQVLLGVGATPIAPAGNYVRRHGDVVMFHVGEAGEYRISLPANMSKTRELFTGHKYNSSELTLKAKGPETYLFKATK